MRTPYKMKGYSYPGTSPAKHAPYAKPHQKHEGKIAHPNTAAAHGKKKEDYYDGSKGKEISTTGATRNPASYVYKNKQGYTLNQVINQK